MTRQDEIRAVLRRHGAPLSLVAELDASGLEVAELEKILSGEKAPGSRTLAHHEVARVRMQATSRTFWRTGFREAKR